MSVKLTKSPAGVQFQDLNLEMCPVGIRMPRQGVMSVTQNDFREMI